MATMTGPRKSISVHDYPEHLNPFREDDNHNKIRFWTIGRKLNRSNSITFSGIKDLKNSWAFRSFMKKGKKGQQTSAEEIKKNNQLNGDTSPVVFRRAVQYSSMSTAGPGARSTVGSPERYVYGGSVTPLPRSRFQERLRSPSQHEVSSISVTPRMARSEITGSRLSVESTNPFDEDPVPPVRASRRKKKRAPLPPSGTADSSFSSQTSVLQINEVENKKTTIQDTDLEELGLTVELKIVEDEDFKHKNIDETNVSSKEILAATSHEEQPKEEFIDENKNVTEHHGNRETTMKGSDSEDDILNKVSFPKIDINRYRRNSSLNEDDIRLRRGNLEDFHSLSNKRSKSLTNALDPAYIVDIDLNDNRNKDTNGNEEPQKVICKVYNETSRKQSIDNSISSTEKEFIEIDRATRELEKEISKLNTALIEDDHILKGTRLSVSDIKKRFDKNDVASPNPIPKPRRSHYDGSTSPVNLQP